MSDDTSRSRWRAAPRRAAVLAAAAGIALLAAACGNGPSPGGPSSSPSGPAGPSSSAAGGPTARQTQQAQLTWSQCMRAHGVDVPTSVPGAEPSGTAAGAVKLGGTAVNPDSPQYHAAQQACQSLQSGETQIAG